MRKRREVEVIHHFRDGTVSRTTEGHYVPAEICEIIAALAAEARRKAAPATEGEENEDGHD